MTQRQRVDDDDNRHLNSPDTNRTREGNHMFDRRKAVSLLQTYKALSIAGVAIAWRLIEAMEDGDQQQAAVEWSKLDRQADDIFATLDDLCSYMESQIDNQADTTARATPRGRR